MKAADEHLVRSMKSRFVSDLQEWLGFDIPDEGTDDYEAWQDRVRQIDGIASISDAIEYAESHVGNFNEFVEEFGIESFVGER